MKRLIEKLRKSRKFYVDLEINIFSLRKEFLEGAVENFMYALSEPYVEEEGKKRFSRFFYYDIMKATIAPEGMSDEDLMEKMRLEDSNKIPQLYRLVIRPRKKYDIKSLEKDILVIYTIVKDASLEAKHSFKMKYTLELDKEDNVIVNQWIGFLKMSYPLKDRVSNFASNPDSDLKCFIDDTLDKVLVKLRKATKNKQILGKLKTYSKQLK